MRIGTWNVNYAFRGRVDALAKVLDQNRADIWILTETHDDLAPDGCIHFAHSEERVIGFPAGIRLGSRWVSIWSNYPIINKVLASERTVAALIDVGGDKELLVYGTVLPWQDKIAGWSEHERIIPMQCAEWLELRKKYPNTPLCIAGDLNTDMADGRRYGTKRGIADLRAGFSDAGVFCSTEPERFPPGSLPILPIDHIALPVEWENITSVVASWPADRANLSDHSGMVVEVSI